MQKRHGAKIQNIHNNKIHTFQSFYDWNWRKCLINIWLPISGTGDFKWDFYTRFIFCPEIIYDEYTVSSPLITTNNMHEHTVS